MNNTCDLSTKHCVPCEGGVAAFSEPMIKEYLASLPGWHYDAGTSSIYRRFEFKGYGKTMSFCNAVAWIANQENHHPDMMVGFNYCEVRFQTHAIGGLSENDFICATKVNKLFD